MTLILSTILALSGVAGVANYADPIHGDDYLAIRAERGTLVRICGAGECQVMRSTDYGPAKHTGDIADIALSRFADICGWSIEHASRMGECDVVIEYLGEPPPLPETDAIRVVEFTVQDLAANRIDFDAPDYGARSSMVGRSSFGDLVR